MTPEPVVLVESCFGAEWRDVVNFSINSLSGMNFGLNRLNFGLNRLIGYVVNS